MIGYTPDDSFSNKDDLKRFAGELMSEMVDRLGQPDTFQVVKPTDRNCEVFKTAESEVEYVTFAPDKIEDIKKIVQKDLESPPNNYLPPVQMEVKFESAVNDTRKLLDAWNECCSPPTPNPVPQPKPAIGFVIAYVKSGINHDYCARQIRQQMGNRLSEEIPLIIFPTEGDNERIEYLKLPSV